MVEDKKWWTIDIDNIFSELESSSKGISYSSAEKRLLEFGENLLPEQKTRNVFSIFLSQFASPLIYILFGSALALLFLGKISDSLIIFFVVLLNAIIGSIQEGKAENSLIALKKMIKGNANVFRDGNLVTIDDSFLVPGDVIEIRAGDKIPADSRIIFATDLKVDESAFTGESVPAHKKEISISDENTQIGDIKNMLFKGSVAVSGSSRAIVVGTGLNTVVGKISKQLATIDTDIPLKKSIKKLSRSIMIISFSIAVFVFFIGILFGNGIEEMFATVVSLLVSIIPEGLPIVLTLVLATGVIRMSKRNALVRKLQAIEALGQASIIAVDKTGTITLNELTVIKVVVGKKEYGVSGEGYSKEGSVTFNREVIEPLNHEDLIFLGKLASLSSESVVSFDDKNKIWNVFGDPTEAAILVLSEKIGFDKDELLKEIPQILRIPFDYVNKFHLSSFKEKDGKNLSIISGAPESIIKKSKYILNDSKSNDFTEGEKKDLLSKYHEISKEGLRVVALGYKIDSGNKEEEDYVFAGLIGMKDVLRSDVKSSMKLAKQAGVKVVMITGDHFETAKSIAREAGIFSDGDKVITGYEIDNLSEEEFAKLIPTVTVFARVSPDHKLKIIKAFRDAGEIIAMTGDGANDALSLVAADLGVSMGKRGTDVAKDASDMILLDDNFGNIIYAIEEGRNIYRTIKKVILYLFSTSLGEVFAISVAIVIGLPLPILPAQIIWLNLVTDGFLVVALAMEPRSNNLISKKIDKKGTLIDKAMIFRMVNMAFPMVFFSILLFAFYLDQGLPKALTVSLTSLAMFQWWNAWNSRHENGTIFSLKNFNFYLLFATVAVIFLHFFAVYNPFMQKILGTVAIGVDDWINITIISLFIVAFEEIRKLLVRFRFNLNKTGV